MKNKDRESKHKVSDENNEGNLSVFLNKRVRKFPKNLEESYVVSYFYKSIHIVRISLILGIVLYSIFGFLDVYLVPENRTSFFIIRYAIVSPLLFITFLLSFWKKFISIMNFMMGIIVFTAGFGIITMIAIIKVGDTSLYYYAGLILVIMWGYTFTRLNFITATIICWIIVAGYELTSIFYQGLLNHPELTLVFINNNFFFISANVLGMFVAYFIELSERNEFIQDKIISENQRQLTLERNILAEKNKKIKEEMDMAKVIQQQLIPKKTPGSHISAIYRPMEEVGGDFYDFFYFKDSNKIGIFLSDVAGHGVPAAFVTSMIKSILVESKKLLDDPGATLNHLNSILVNQTQNYFVTVFYGIYDKKNNTLKFANGGHTDPYVCLPDKIKQLKLKEHRLPIGTFPNEILESKDILYRNYNVVIPEKSKVVFYTDGLIEAKKNVQSQDCFEDVITDVLNTIKSENPETFVTRLYQKLIDFKGNENFEDDICIICLDTDYADDDMEDLEEL